MSKILVVDDAPAVAATCVQALADAGHSVRVVTP
jgi:CheY-like chemotaxis protein